MNKRDNNFPPSATLRALYGARWVAWSLRHAPCHGGGNSIWQLMQPVFIHINGSRKFPLGHSTPLETLLK